MYPATFDFVRATDLDHAVRLLAEHEDAKVLAGGHSLVPMMKLRMAQPTTVIDISRIDTLRGIQAMPPEVRIGALTTHGELAASKVLRQHVPLLAEAAAAIGDLQVRNKGTLGGNIAHADPASDLPAALVALGAQVEVMSATGRRQVAATDFFVDLLVTDLTEGEIVTSVSVPIHGASHGSAYLKYEHPASGYAVCGAAAIVKGGQVTLCFNGLAATPVLATAVSEALAGSELDDASIDAAVDQHLTVDDPLADLFASGEFRVTLAKAYGKRAIKAARDRAMV